MTRTINLDKVYYVKEENSSEMVAESQICIRDISSVSDYLRAITMVHSNYFILKYGKNADIKYFENIFSRSETKDSLDNIIANGVYFRGQTKDYNYVIPSLYRDSEGIVFENELIKRAEISSPGEFNSIKYFLSRLALMQHYGLNTRILDITTNALVALYFAVEDGYIKPDDPKYGDLDDGIVYLYKKEQPEIEVEYSEKIATKANISQLSFLEKVELYQAVQDISNNDVDLIDLFKSNHVVSSILRKLSNFVQKDLGYPPMAIRKGYLIGSDIVYASEVDSRLVRQNGLFVIWGLDGLQHAFKDEDGGWIINLENIKETIDKTLSKREFLYSPEIFLGVSHHPANVRIKIKKEYKAQLLSELKLLGITGQSIYPDLQHKLEYINNLSMEK